LGWRRDYRLFGWLVVRWTLHDAPHTPQNNVCSPKCSSTGTVFVELHVGQRGSFGVGGVVCGSARSFLFIFAFPVRGDLFAWMPNRALGVDEMMRTKSTTDGHFTRH
jgi:hypothetical protein